MLIGCTLVDDSIALTRAAHNVGLLPNQLKSLFLTVGPTKPVFVEQLGNLSELVVAPSQWHHSMRYSDPYFGSTQHMNAEFAMRYGYDMDYVTASAVATGVTLRLALEQASEPTSVSTRQSLRTDNCMAQTETFFGTVRMSGEGHAQGTQRNIGHSPAVLQIVNGETKCVLPVDAASAILQTYRAPEISLAGCTDCAQFIEADRALAQFSEPGASAMDMRGNSLRVRSQWRSEAYDAARPGIYNLEYTAQDRAGFVSTRHREVGEYCMTEFPPDLSSVTNIILCCSCQRFVATPDQSPLWRRISVWPEHARTLKWYSMVRKCWLKIRHRYRKVWLRSA